MGAHETRTSRPTLDPLFPVRNLVMRWMNESEHAAAEPYDVEARYMPNFWRARAAELVAAHVDAHVNPLYRLADECWLKAEDLPADDADPAEVAMWRERSEWLEAEAEARTEALRNDLAAGLIGSPSIMELDGAAYDAEGTADVEIAWTTRTEGAAVSGSLPVRTLRALADLVRHAAIRV